MSEQQRASGFLIDEYGNEHDPEHCRFKTLATATRHARSSTSSSSASSRSSASLRSSASSTGSSTGTTDPSPPSSSTHSSHLPAHLALSHTHTLPSAGPAGARPSCWSSLRPHGRRAKPAADSAPARWTKTLWAHLRPAPPDAPPPRTHAYHLHHPTHPIFSIPVAPFPHPAHPRRKRLLCPSDPASNSLPLSALRKRLELVKLEVRFGILRTRKRVLGTGFAGAFGRTRRLSAVITLDMNLTTGPGCRNPMQNKDGRTRPKAEPELGTGGADQHECHRRQAKHAQIEDQALIKFGI
ncbi:hypothetical protein PtB15_17B37 [Puccinia triticina]|nr:hypothetical protein PtB15_17B37 [Puccinia triticina]